MKEQFGEALDVEIHLNVSEAAKGYVLRGATTVLVDEQWVPLEIATSRGRMAEFLGKIVPQESS